MRNDLICNYTNALIVSNDVTRSRANYKRKKIEFY